MWNKVAYVAKHQNLPEADLVDFALAHDSKYSIVVENGDAIVSNWHVDRLIEDFLDFQLEQEAAEDQYLIDTFAPESHDVGCEFDPKLR